jgi:hypothetical protein
MIYLNEDTLVQQTTTDYLKSNLNGSMAFTTSQNIKKYNWE